MQEGITNKMATRDIEITSSGFHPRDLIDYMWMWGLRIDGVSIPDEYNLCSREGIAFARELVPYLPVDYPKRIRGNFESAMSLGVPPPAGYDFSILLNETTSPSEVELIIQKHFAKGYTNNFEPKKPRLPS